MTQPAPPSYRLPRGFTLIEPLIVVAIIAILAAIAVPNFLEAQTRSKVSRARADTRTIVTGLEQYRVDNGRYPLDPIGGQAAGRTDIRSTPLLQVTTPIAYITSIPENVFPNKTDASLYSRSLYRYFAEDWKNQQLAGRPSDPLYRDVGWIYTVATSGPDGISNLGE